MGVPSSSDEFVAVRVPFKSFSDKWSPAMGEQTTTCADDKDVCPEASTLTGIKRIEVWAEGVAGAVHLEIQSISAEAAGAVVELTTDPSSQPPSKYNRCKGGVQSQLRYGISGRDTPAGVPVPVDATESLANAVCCDSRMLPFAEPQFLFEAPDILLFDTLKEGDVTTFYDSVCGVPLFRAPINRTFAEFQADTQEHGWPSFRPAEVIAKNVLTDKATGYVTSSCGTHLGSFLPDDKGDRWCMDLSCVAGNPAVPIMRLH